MCEENNKTTCNVNQEKIEQIQQNMVREEILYDVADFYKVLGDSTRLKILYALLDTEMCVGDLSNVFNLSPSLISHQLRVLRQNDLVKFRKQGKWVYYSLDDAHVEALLTQGLEHILHKKVYEY